MRQGAGAREAGAGRVGHPAGLGLPAIVEDELAHRAAPQRPVGSLGHAEGNGGGEEDVLGNLQQLAQRGLAPDVPDRDGAAVAQGARS